MKTRLDRLMVDRGLAESREKAQALIMAGEVRVTGAKNSVLKTMAAALLAEGRTMKEIAGILGISLSTVADHKYHIMQLLQIKTNAELFQYAVRRGIVSL
jgi:UDP-N-acetylglucosamine enolpyruvyl transferase